VIFSELNCVNMASEILDLLENGNIRDKRLVFLLNELMLDNEAIDIVNIAVLKLKEGELSEEDMVKYINMYKVSRTSVVD